jgi:hypothetical protein
LHRSTIGAGGIGARDRNSDSLDIFPKPFVAFQKLGHPAERIDDRAVIPPAEREADIDKPDADALPNNPDRNKPWSQQPGRAAPGKHVIAGYAVVDTRCGLDFGDLLPRLDRHAHGVISASSAMSVVT